MVNPKNDQKNKMITKINITLKNTIYLTLILSTTGCVFCGKPPNNIGLFCVNASAEQNQQNLALFGSFPNPSDLKMIAEHDIPGQSPAFSGSAFIPAGSLQTYEAIVRFPPPFTVSPNGFLDIAPVGSNMGSYQIDLNGDDITDAEFPVISESPFFAWMDVNGNNLKDMAEPEMYQSQDMNGNALLVVTLPNGGDNNPSNNNGNIDYKMSLHLKSGLFINPMIATNHSITATLQSVDPDTGSMDNGTGLEPEIINLGTLLLIDLIYKDDFE